MRKHRTKRHLAKDCRENDRQSRCCRYPLRVDFRKFGWDWIIAPDIYEAYYCAGECPIGFLPKHPHTYIYSLSSSYSTCCSPRKLSPLSLLYFDDNKNVIHSIIPNMAVEKCGCSQVVALSRSQPSICVCMCVFVFVLVREQSHS